MTEITKNELFLIILRYISNGPFEASFCPNYVRGSALKSPDIILCIFASCEHFRASPEQARAFSFINSSKMMKKRIFMTIPKLLVDARRVLMDAHKVQKYKLWTLGFQTHNFACILHQNSRKYANFNSRTFLHFLRMYNEI